MLLRKCRQIYAVNFDFLCQNAAELRFFDEQVLQIIVSISAFKCLQSVQEVHMILKFRELINGLQETFLYHIGMVAGHRANLRLQLNLPLSRKSRQLLEHFSIALELTDQCGQQAPDLLPIDDRLA